MHHSSANLLQDISLLSSNLTLSILLQTHIYKVISDNQCHTENGT